MRKIIIVAAVFGILLVVFTLARRNSPIFNFIFPPHDKFQPLAVKEVDLTRQGNTVTLQFQPKYPGNHGLDLEVENLDPGAQIKGSLTLSVIIKNNKNEQIAAKPASFSNFWSEKHKGFSLFTFSVPEAVKIGEIGTVIVTVTTPDIRFTEKYGSAHLVVTKGSDE
jgi:hypothetical protein